MDNLHLLEESKQQHSFLEIGFQLAMARNGFGILSMPGEFPFLVIMYKITSINNIILHKSMIPISLNVQQASQLAYKSTGGV